MLIFFFRFFIKIFFIMSLLQYGFERKRINRNEISDEEESEEIEEKMLKSPHRQQ